jgi:endonuclease YncB( thermonuclease family)
MKSIKCVLSIVPLLFLASAALAAQDDITFTSTKTYDRVLVERVVNAGTIVLEGGEKIKLIGLKALAAPRRAKMDYDEKGFIVVPEHVNPVTSVDEEAFEFAKHLLEGKMVRLEFDAQKKTENFETLAYVYLVDKNTFVNAEILRQGFASLQIAAPNLKYAEPLRAAYREARAEKKGLHNE